MTDEPEPMPDEMVNHLINGAEANVVSWAWGPRTVPVGHAALIVNPEFLMRMLDAFEVMGRTTHPLNYLYRNLLREFKRDLPVEGSVPPIGWLPESPHT